MPKKMNDLELTILMPCLNEAETLGTCIRKAISFLERSGIRGEVLVADNGSTDGSPNIALQCGARVVTVPMPGYGSALRGGIEAAHGQYIIMGDADDSYDFSTLEAFVEKLRAGYDLVMGNRFAGAILPNAMPPLHRYLGNPALTAVGRFLFRSPCRDFHCGLRGFDRAAIRQLELKTTGMEFASEMVVRAAIKHLKITEVPTILAPDGRNRPPHLQSWRDGWRHLKLLLLFSPRWLFLYPGAALFVLGCLASLGLVLGEWTIDHVTFDIHTLVYSCLAIVVGFQSVFFWTFAKTFAIGEGLLNPDPAFDRLRRFVRLEIGLIAAVILLLAGCAGTLYAFKQWSAASYGDMSPQQLMRIVIPSGTAICLAFQSIFGAFFISLLDLRSERPHLHPLAGRNASHIPSEH